MSGQFRVLGLAAVATATLYVSACSVQDSMAPSVLPGITVLESHMALDPQPEEVRVCTLYEHGTVLGPGAMFTYSIDDSANGSIDTKGTTALAADQCAILPTMGTKTHEHLVVVKQQVPTGYYMTLRTVEYHAGIYTATDMGVAEMGTAYMHGDRGFTLGFTNHKRGVKGCTYGYWRNDQHVNAWPAQYGPTTLFADAFEDAFPGLTLKQVMELKGSGLNALGRETVAALLNAQAGFFWYLPGEVQTMFNNVYPANNAAYSKLQYRFEGKNLAGCPIN
jgi:hypothetical protein